MKKLIRTLLITSITMSFSISVFAAGEGNHKHKEKKKFTCTEEHAALGHCTMEPKQESQGNGEHEGHGKDHTS